MRSTSSRPRSACRRRVLGLMAFRKTPSQASASVIGSLSPSLEMSKSDFMHATSSSPLRAVVHASVIVSASLGLLAGTAKNHVAVQIFRSIANFAKL